MLKNVAKKQSKTTFVDLKFFLGLIFVIYGVILLITGTYFALNPVSGIDSSIDVYWGACMLLFGVVSYYKSNKPSSWNRAFAVAGIEHIEKRLKGTLEEVAEEL